jgi:hypothetical protein
VGAGDAGSNTARTSTIRRSLRVQREVAAYYSELQLRGRHRHSRLDGMLAEYAVLSGETVVPVPGISPSRKPRPMPRGHRLGGTDPRWRVTAGDTVLTQGSGGRFGLCVAIRSGLRRMVNCNHLYRREGKKAEQLKRCDPAAIRRKARAA